MRVSVANASSFQRDDKAIIHAKYSAIKPG